MKFVYLLFALFPLLAQAQVGRDIPVNIDLGGIDKTTSNARFRKIVAAGEWGSILLRRDDRAAWLETYDQYQRLQKQKAIPIDREERFHDLVILGPRYYVLTSRQADDSRSNWLWCRQIDPTTMRRIGESKPLAELQIDPRRRARRPYDLVFARDSSHLLLYNQAPYQAKGSEQFNLRVFDPSFNLRWEDRIILPYADDLFQIREYRVDQVGRAYVLGRLYSDRPRPTRDGLPNYKYILLSKAGPEDQLWEYEIGFPDKYISDLTCRSNRFGNLVCAGFYAESSDKQVRGMLSFKVDPRGRETYDLHVMPLELGFISDAYQDNERSYGVKGSPELYRYRIRELVQRSDGGLVLVAEQYFVEDTNRPGIYRGVPIPERKYHYNDIIAINIAPGGVIEWARRIPKRQVSVGDFGRHSGFGFAIVQDRFYFVYNDNARNFGPGADIEHRFNLNSSRAVLVLTELQKDGQLANKILLDTREAGVTFRPKLGQQSGRRELLLYGDNGRRYRLLRLTF